MQLSHLVSSTFLNRLLADYTELERSLELHPSEQAEKLKATVRGRITALTENSRGSALNSRALKLELRSLQRTWTRHLVTTARLNRQRRERKNEFLEPIAAA